MEKLAQTDVEIIKEKPKLIRKELSTEEKRRKEDEDIDFLKILFSLLLGFIYYQVFFLLILI